ncbi:hypothetical protein LINPERPRIM_LOCUS101, partial [Linum perenne]
MMVDVLDEHGASGVERSSYSRSYKAKTIKRSKGYWDKCPGSTQNKSRNEEGLQVYASPSLDSLSNR